MPRIARRHRDRMLQHELDVSLGARERGAVEANHRRDSLLFEEPPRRGVEVDDAGLRILGRRADVGLVLLGLQAQPGGDEVHLPGNRNARAPRVVVAVVHEHLRQADEEGARQYQAYRRTPRPPVPRPEWDERCHEHGGDEREPVVPAHARRQAQGNSGAGIAPGRAPQESDHADARGQERREVGQREVEMIAPVEEEERVEGENAVPAERRVREQRSCQPWKHHDTERGRQQRPEDLDDGHIAEPQCAADRVEDMAQQRDGVAAPLVVVREQREAAAIVEQLPGLPVLVRVVVERVVARREEVDEVDQRHEGEARGLCRHPSHPVP